MPLLKKEDLELLDPALRKTLEEADARFDATLSEKEKSDKMIKEIEDFTRNIYQNPQAVEKFKELVKLTGAKIEVPDPPARKYVEPLEKKIADLEKERSDEKKAEAKKAILNRARELGISEEEIKTKVTPYQEKHGITNNLSALELYAKEREPEIPNVEYQKPFTFDKAPDETVATNNALKEIRALKSSVMGR